MRLKTLTIIASLICALSTLRLEAQAWSGILDTNHAIDWSNPGVSGGIPTNRTQCGSTINAYNGSAATINSAIGSCGADKYVLLGSGTFNLTSGITFGGTSNVTLRGAGPDATKLIFTGDTSCQGQRADVCIEGNDFGYYAFGPPTHIVTWSAGYTKGTTSITLSSTSGLSVGMYIVLDQLDDTVDNSNIFICSTGGGTCTDEGGGSNSRSSRGLYQMTKVTNISGGSVTISPGLYMPNWSGSKTPQAWWGNSGSLSTKDGIENLSVDSSDANNDNACISFVFTTNSWVKNVRAVNCPSPRAMIEIFYSPRATVRDSYLVGSQADAGASTNYGIETIGSWDSLIENNIVQHRTAPFIRNGDQGSVWGYNFAIDDHYSASPTFMQSSSITHEMGDAMVLEEGNSGIQFAADIIHGEADMITSFRSYYIGWETGKTSNTIPVEIRPLNRYFHIIGAVLGRSVYHNAYQTGSATSIFQIGEAVNSVAADSRVLATLMRWGNYDPVTGAVRWCGNSSNTGWVAICGSTSEVPSGDSFYPNAVPSTETLPNSFYLSGQPSWWATAYGTPKWPAIGPDVTGGNISNVGGHADKIPAQLCYENMSADSAYTGDPAGVKVFNADTCYTGGDAVNPTPGNSGTITTANVAATTLTLNWTKGTDDVSAQANLQYEVCQSTSNNITSVANCEAATVIRSFTADIATFNVTGLTASTSYYFNVVIKDEAGNKAAYTTVNQATSSSGTVGYGPSGLKWRRPCF